MIGCFVVFVLLHEDGAAAEREIKGIYQRRVWLNEVAEKGPEVEKGNGQLVIGNRQMRKAKDAADFNRMVQGAGQLKPA